MEAVKNFVPALTGACLSVYQTMFIQQSRFIGSKIPVHGGFGLSAKSTEGGREITVSSSECNVEGLSGSIRTSLYTPDATEMRRVFERLDENRDGLICAEDLGRFVKRLGFAMTDEDVWSMLKSADLNSDDSVDFEEFFSLFDTLCGNETMVAAEEEPETVFLQAFAVFDQDNDGYISPSELQLVLVSLGLCEGDSLSSCQRMIDCVDVDGNGQVDFDEFKVMMCSDAFQL